MGEPTFWDDPDQAQKITQELNGVKAGVDKYKNILHKFEEMQILWEMGMEDKTVGISPVGCAVFAYNYLDIDWQEAAHGRAPAVATAVKRLWPDRLVFTIMQF